MSADVVGPICVLCGVRATRRRRPGSAALCAAHVGEGETVPVWIKTALADRAEVLRRRAERKAERARRKRRARWSAIARVEWQREQPRNVGAWIEHMRADKAKARVNT